MALQRWCFSCTPRRLGGQESLSLGGVGIFRCKMDGQA